MMTAERFEKLRSTRVRELERLKADGTRVVGYFSYYTPLEVIAGAGAVPVRLYRGGHDAEVRGTKYLRSDACPFCLSAAGNFETDPLYKLVDAVVAVNTCDMLRRLPETIHRQFGLPVYQVYMPRTSEPLAHRVAEFERQLRWLADELAVLTGRVFGEQAAAEAADAQNRVRRQLRELDRTRLDEPPGAAGSEILRLVSLVTLVGPGQAGPVIAEALNAAGRSRGQDRRPRLALAGSEVTELDRWLVELVEGRADIVTDLLDSGTRWFADDVELTGDAVADLAAYYYSRTPDITRRPNDRAYAVARKRLAEARAQGLVYKTLLYCDPWVFEAVRMRQTVGLPMLHVDGNYSEENREQLRTRVEAFLENL